MGNFGGQLTKVVVDVGELEGSQCAPYPGPKVNAPATQSFEFIQPVASCVQLRECGMFGK
jgi:hypothetical protein